MKNMCLSLASIFVLSTATAPAQLVFFSFGNTDPVTTTVDEDLLTGVPTFTQFGADIVANGAAGVAFSDSSGTSWTAGDAVSWDSGVNDAGGNNFTLSFNSTGFENFQFRFDYRSTGTGPASFSSIQYRVNSGSFATLTGAATSLTNDSNFQVWSFDASALSAMENAGLVDIRWAFTPGTSTGTFRLDNLQVTGSSIPEPSTYALIGAGLLGLLLLRRNRNRSEMATAPLRTPQHLS